MVQLGKLLKDEMKRLSKREVNVTVRDMRKQLTHLRRTVAELRRQAKEMNRIVSRLDTEARKQWKRDLDPDASEVTSARFTAANIRKLRDKLSLSRREFALLVNVVPGTVYLWEKGKAIPRRQARARLVKVRQLGKREAKLRIVEAGDTGPKPAAPKAKSKKRAPAKKKTGSAAAKSRGKKQKKAKKKAKKKR